MELISLILAAIPPLALIVVVWWLDRYEREPPRAVAMVMGWGALGAIFFSSALEALPAAFASALFEPRGGEAFTAVLIAPPVEEAMKGLALVWLFWRRRYLDNTTDGFVYGAAAGLGFALTENFSYYVMVAPQGPEVYAATVFIRSLFSLSTHMLASSLFGATLGYARSRGGGAERGWRWGAPGFAAAVALHMAWNGFAMASGFFEAPGLMLLGCLMIGFTLLLVLALGQAALAREGRRLRRELEEEERWGALPPGHAAALAAGWTRLTRRWAPRHLDLERYRRLAVRLAMTKSEYRRAPAPELAAKIQSLRLAIRALFAEPRSWYLFLRGRVWGPWPESRLLSEIERGRIPPQAPLWAEGLAAWAPAREVAARLRAARQREESLFL